VASGEFIGVAGEDEFLIADHEHIEQNPDEDDGGDETFEAGAGGEYGGEFVLSCESGEGEGGGEHDDGAGEVAEKFEYFWAVVVEDAEQDDDGGGRGLVGSGFDEFVELHKEVEEDA